MWLAVACRDTLMGRPRIGGVKGVRTLVSRFRVLVALDDATGGLEPVRAAVNVLGHMPNIEITAFARTMGVTSSAGGGALLAPLAVSRLVSGASELARSRGIGFRVHETGLPLLEALAREAPSHDLLILPKDLGHEAAAFGVPVLLT